MPWQVRTSAFNRAAAPYFRNYSRIGHLDKTISKHTSAFHSTSIKPLSIDSKFRTVDVPFPRFKVSAAQSAAASVFPVNARVSPFGHCKSYSVLSSAAPPSKSLKWTKRTLIIAGFSLVAYLIDQHYNARTAQRNLLTAWTGLQIAIDYKFNFDRNNLESINALHERCADRLLHVCEKNQGLYIKLGQAIGVQAAVLPKPYHQLAKLFDNAERLPYEQVRKVLVEELGAEPEEIFASFNQIPVAAASIAQVHRARLKPPPGSPEGTLGPEVAVKVQRPNIRRYAKWDLWSFRILLGFYERIFELPLSYFGQYISDQIEKETIFDHELKNSLRAKTAIENDPEKLIRQTCYVPEMYQQFCTPRVLTMEWIDGACKMTDRVKIEGEMGLNVKAVAKSVCELFASQIFQHGFVQADGHPSNVLVRKHPNRKEGQHQIVLIDHGLCVELSEEFRRKYARLWKAIFTLDLKTLDEITVSWGMGAGSSELFASATLLRPWSKPSKKRGLKKGKHADQTDLELQREIKEKIKTFLVHVELLPQELIFVGRSMRIIQANNQVLGSPVNRLNILARHAAAALLSPTTPSLYRVLIPVVHSNNSTSFNMRLSEWLHDRLDYIRFRSSLLILDFAFFGSRFYSWLRFLFRHPVKLLTGDDTDLDGFEDHLEQSMRKMARDEFGVELDSNAFMG